MFDLWVLVCDGLSLFLHGILVTLLSSVFRKMPEFALAVPYLPVFNILVLLIPVPPI